MLFYWQLVGAWHSVGHKPAKIGIGDSLQFMLFYIGKCGDYNNTTL